MKKTVLLFPMLICVWLFISCNNNKINPLTLPDVNECDSIIIEEFLNHMKRHVFTNESQKAYILSVLHQDLKAELCKMYPKLIITIKGKKNNESFGVSGEFIKKEGITYKYPINIEKELYKCLKEQSIPQE